MTLEQFLDERAKQEDVAGAESTRVRQEWGYAIELLINNIKNILSDADKHKILTIERERHRIREERIGTYEADGLLVRLGATEVRVIPVARYSVGSMVGDSPGATLRFGRVDITDGSEKFMLYRRGENDDWVIIDPVTYQPIPFDRSSVEDIFVKLLK